MFTYVTASSNRQYIPVVQCKLLQHNSWTNVATIFCCTLYTIVYTQMKKQPQKLSREIKDFNCTSENFFQIILNSPFRKTDIHVLCYIYSYISKSTLILLVVYFHVYSSRQSEEFSTPKLCLLSKLSSLLSQYSRYTYIYVSGYMQVCICVSLHVFSSVYFAYEIVIVQCQTCMLPSIENLRCCRVYYASYNNKLQ